MGSITVAGFLGLALLGLLLLGAGVYRRARPLIAAGSAILLALGGAWLFGLPGAAASLIALPLGPRA